MRTEPSREDYDVAIIGAGAAGNNIASAVARQERSVALIERDRLGGTCLNFGCDPTKALLHAAQLMHRARGAARYGFATGEVQPNWLGALRWARQVVDTMRGGGHEALVAKKERQGVEVIRGAAAFLDSQTLAVGEQRLRADRIVVATGARAAVPPVPGLAQAGYWTAKDVFNIEALPARIAVLGGGPVGVEFAQVFARFGSRVTLIEIAPQILPSEDAELAQLLAASLAQDGIEVRAATRLTAVEAEGAERRLRLEPAATADPRGAETLPVDAILVASGRRAALAGLNLEAAGVETHEDGIVVDECLRTTAEHVWAAGDVIGNPRFTHVADKHVGVVACNLFAETPRPYREEHVPICVHTDPALARVGPTERELQDAGAAYDTFYLPLERVSRAVANGETHGGVKVLRGPEGEVLAGHVLAPDGGSLLAPLCLAVRRGLPVCDLAETMIPYPTMADAVFDAANECCPITCTGEGWRQKETA